MRALAEVILILLLCYLVLAGVISLTNPNCAQVWSLQKESDPGRETGAAGLNGGNAWENGVTVSQ